MVDKEEWHRREELRDLFEKIGPITPERILNDDIISLKEITGRNFFWKKVTPNEFFYPWREMPSEWVYQLIMVAGEYAEPILEIAGFENFGRAVQALSELATEMKFNKS